MLAILVIRNYQHFNDHRFAPAWSPPKDLSYLFEPSSKTALLKFVRYHLYNNGPKSKI